uniref:Uncharacterized protein n=1 Tax=Romanomermis culicivorax TaxID=13658 RepID=A0A915I4S9_ROMCU
MPKIGVGTRNESGAAKRKRKAQEEKTSQSMQGALLKHFRPSSNTEKEPNFSSQDVSISDSIDSQTAETPETLGSTSSQQNLSNVVIADNLVNITNNVVISRSDSELSDLAQCMELWLGFSVITCFEVVDVLVELICWWIASIKNIKKFKNSNIISQAKSCVKMTNTQN